MKADATDASQVGGPDRLEAKATAVPETGMIQKQQLNHQWPLPEVLGASSPKHYSTGSES